MEVTTDIALEKISHALRGHKRAETPQKNLPIVARLHAKILEDMRASREAKKEADRTNKIAIALRKAAAETAAETASDNSMEIKVGKIIEKFYQFYKDYENEEYNRVKAKVSD